MAFIYVDNILGNDSGGDGSSLRPYKTIAKSLNVSGLSDEIILFDGFHPVDEPLIFDGSGAKVLRAQNANQATITSSTPLDRLLSIESNGISFLNFNIEQVQSLVVINVYGAANSIISGIHIKNISINTAIDRSVIDTTNSQIKFLNLSIQDISCTGAGKVTLVKCNNSVDTTILGGIIENITSEAQVTGMSFGLNAVRIRVENFQFKEMHSSNATAMSRGIELGIGNSQVEVEIISCFFKNCGMGIWAEDSFDAHQNIYIYRNVFYDTIYGIYAKKSELQTFNNTLNGSNFAFVANNNSQIEILNTVTSNTADHFNLGTTFVFTAYDSSIIDIRYTNVFNSIEEKETDASSRINYVENILRLFPKFVDVGNDNFNLDSSSPLIDGGTVPPIDFTHLGKFYDVGAEDALQPVHVGTVLGILQSKEDVPYEFIDRGFLDIQKLAKDAVEGLNPDVFVREGSAINDLMVKPTAALVQKLADEISFMQETLTMRNAYLKSEMQMDSLAGNFFLTRIPEAQSIGSVRVSFDKPVDISIPYDTRFATLDGAEFFARVDVTATADNMTANFDPVTGMYYVDVPIASVAVGKEYNVDEDTIRTADLLKADNVVAITNPDPLINGRAAETNPEFLSRIRISIGKKSLVNKPGINSIILEAFTEFINLKVVGYLDPEMKRDLLSFLVGKNLGEIDPHMGGHTDIWVKSRLLSDTYYDIIDMPEIITLDASNVGAVPIVVVKELEILDPGSRAPTGVYLAKDSYTIQVIEPNHRYSVLEQLHLQLKEENGQPSQYIGQNVRVHYGWVPSIYNLHTFLTDDFERVTCENALARHFIPIFITGEIFYEAPEDISDAANLVKDYLVEIAPGGVMNGSDIIDLLYNNGATYVREPISLNIEQHSLDGSITERLFEDFYVLQEIEGFIGTDITVTRLNA